MPHTDSYVAVAQAILTILDTNKDTLGLKAVWYGDQGALNPTTPYACVEPSTKARELVGAQGPGGQTENTFEVVIMVYHDRIGPNTATRLECDQFAEAVEALLHTDDNIRLGGIVIHGFVATMESGQATVGGALFQATRMTWRGITHTLL